MNTERLNTMEPAHYLIQLTYLLILSFAFTTSMGCGKEDKPKVTVSPELAGIWAFATATDIPVDILYIISLNSNGASGVIEVEASGKTLRKLQFVAADNMTITILEAKRGPHDGNVRRPMEEIREIFRLRDPPNRLYFSHSAPGTSVANFKCDLFVGGFSEPDSPYPLKKIPENGRIQLPFDEVTLDVDLQIPSGTTMKFDYSGGAWGATPTTFTKPVHPTGHVKSISIGGHSLLLASSEIVEGMVATKDFGPLEIMMRGTGKGKVHVLATRNQIKAIRNWMDSTGIKTQSN